MEAIFYFILIPALFALLQFFLARSKAHWWVKWSPATLVGLIILVCFLGMIDWLPLPQTYWMDKGSFMAFPDYIYVGMFCIPALVGLGIGTFMAVCMGMDRK